MRVGVLGLGFGIHLVHTLANRADVTLAALADRNPDRGVKGLADRYGATGYRDGPEMIDRADLDAVVIATPPHGRLETLQAAVSRNLPVFLEKPIAATDTQAKAVAELCQGSRVMVGFSFRFHPPVRELLAQTGAWLGKGRVLNAAYLFDWLPAADSWLWDSQRGGGFFNENSCHLIDIVIKLMGMPSEIAAFGADDGTRPSPSAAAATMKFPNGGVAALTLGGIGVGAFDDFPRLDLVCENGQAQMRGRDHMWTGLTWAERGAKTLQTVNWDPERLGATRYSAAFDHFFEALRTGNPFEATLRDGVNAVEIAEGIYHALRSGAVFRRE